MRPKIGLSHMTAIELTPPEIVTCAADAGFKYLGVRLAPARPGEGQHPMLGDTPMMRETLARLRDTGVEVFDIDILRLQPNTDIKAFEPVLAAGARLGAKHLLVAVDHEDEPRMADVLSDLRTFHAITSWARSPWPARREGRKTRAGHSIRRRRRR